MRKKLSVGILILVLTVGVFIYQTGQDSKFTQKSKDKNIKISQGSLSYRDHLIEILESQAKNSGINPSKFKATYVSLRQSGKILGRAWGSYGDSKKQIAIALEKIIKNNSKAFEKADSVILCQAYDFKVSKKPVNLNKWNIHRGVRGIRINYKGKRTRACPTYMISTNQSFNHVLAKFIKSNKFKNVVYDPNKVSTYFKIESFEAIQTHIDIKSKKPTPLFRGNLVIGMEEITQDNIEKFASKMALWLVNNTNNEDGKINYKYFPSIGEYSESNNMIRQFMANIALNRWARTKNDNSLKELAVKALAYNLGQFYKEIGDIGVIDYSGKMKLGAAALAALAIHESSQRSKFAEQEKLLQKALLGQWEDSGKFKTFIGTDRDDNQNFYPGETLYYWSYLLEEKLDKGLLEKFMKSFSFYKTWHMQNRNPAFIPWHTQAYYKVWKLTKKQELAETVFLMNDWLISEMQVAESKEIYKDTFGRFYKAGGKYGPPHASSTGVYLEGLSDALSLAKDLGDNKREQAYTMAIRRGLRSSMQLQFQDEIDMFYISKRKQVFGALRTTVYDNIIRVDNVQHTLLGVLKILKQEI